MEDYRKIAIELGNTLISKAPETREDVERMMPELKESEDEKMSRELISYFKNNSVYVKWSGLDVKKVIQWLEKQGKKPMDKVEQKPAWSENDEMIALSIEQIFNCASLLNIVPDKIEKVRSWLKSLKDRIQPQPQPQWKPSEENIKDLEWCAELVKDNLGTPFHRIMVFIDELKKLK